MNKKNLVLGGILVLLVVIAYAYQGPFREWRDSWGKPDNFLAKVDISQADKISINQAGEMTELEKIGDKWRISGTRDFYVKDETVNEITTQWSSAKEAEIELVGENIDKKGDFETSEEAGTVVKLSQGESVLSEFVVGKPGSDFTSTYISEINSDKTYLVPANLRLAFVRSDWLDRTIFEEDKEKISKIRFQYPTREFTIEKGEGEEAEWTGVLPYKFAVDKEKAEEVLNIFSNLRSVEIPEQTFEGTGLEKNLIIVQATGEETDLTLMVGEAQAVETEGEEEIDEEMPKLYYAKKGDSDNIYLITEEQRNILDKQIRDFR